MIGATAPTTSSDVKNLFALYQGLTALEGVAEQAQTTGATASQLQQYQASFASGLSQVQSYLATDPLKNATVVTRARRSPSAQSTVGVKTETDVYSGQPLFTGGADAARARRCRATSSSALTLTNLASHTPTMVNFDLSDLGDTPPHRAQRHRLPQLQAGGRPASPRVSRRSTTPAQPLTVKNADGTTKTIAPPANSDSWSLQLKGSSTELASFSAPASTPAVYVAQTAGGGAATAQQLLKLDGAPSADPASTGSATTLPSYVSAVRSTATGPDGSVYVLADITGTTSDGQTVNGASDVALLKYDSAGGLQYTRTLGSASAAQGFGLAVSADGSQVAVTGAVTGDLDKQNPATDPTQPNTFVSVFNSQGVEQWTQTAQGSAGDTPSAVTFGPDGSVYVTGKTNSTLHDATSQGGEDGFLLGFSAAGTKTIATQFGTSGADAGVGLVATAQGVTVASVENGHAVLRRYASDATGDAQPTAVRDLGDLQGGGIAGLTVAADGSLVLAGATSNGALSAGTVRQAYDGSGQDVFVAKLSPDLSGASDSLAYWDAGADATASGVTVSGGQVYVTGSLTGSSGAGSNGGAYAVAIDPTSGQPTWAESFAGQGGQAAPTSIAVDPSGSSVLDALGLPNGAIDYSATSDLIANTSLRPGDQFEVQVGGGPATAVTIAQGETLSSLALKINRATGFQSAATVVTVNGYQQLKIAPANTRAQVSLLSGPSGRDALAPLGLTEGTVTASATASAKPVSKGTGAGQTIAVAKPYALALSSTLSVASAASAKQAQTLIATALSTVRQAYSDLTTPPSTATASGGAVPAYLTAQIANYQLALARLTGSS